MKAITIFTDIRGFTGWSRDLEVFEDIDQFISKFYDLLKENFPQPTYYKKGLGDGSMIVREIDEKTSPENLTNILRDILNVIENVERKFASLCTEFAHTTGHAAPLKLGWGISRGPVKKLTQDYIGASVNTSSRLCSIARPYGIAIEADNFPILPNFSPYSFSEQHRKLSGVPNDVRVWVTPEIASQFLPRENIRQKPEVHVAGVCVKEEAQELKILLAKRNAHRRLYPNLYEGCGGQLAYSESFADAVARHYRLELNLQVEVIEQIHCFYKIEEPEEPFIPGIRFVCKYISGEAKSFNHSEIIWVTEEELKKIPAGKFIPDMRHEFLALISQFKEFFSKTKKRR